MTAKISFGMMLSVDGYVAGPEAGPSLPVPDEPLHRYFNEQQRRIVLNVYGRRLYEMMRYWEDADAKPESTPVELDFATAWKDTPKVVVSATLESVGPNARLVKSDVVRTVSQLKAEMSGEIEVGGPTLAASLARHGLIDEFRLYVYPVVLGGGTPFFEAKSFLQLEPLGSERLPQNVTLLRFRPAQRT
ncbi:MAG: dihydrofolate reductase family protein [Pseudomonadota bacterium]